MTGIGDPTSPELANPNVNLFGKLSYQADRLGLIEAHLQPRGCRPRHPRPPCHQHRRSPGGCATATSSPTAATSSTTHQYRPGSSGPGSSATASPTSFWPGIRPSGTSGCWAATSRWCSCGRLRGHRRTFLAAGAERFSQLNSLDQDIFSLQNNLSFGTGDHRITVGTANEFYKFDNAFFQARIGVWAFNNLDSLAAGLRRPFSGCCPRRPGPRDHCAVQRSAVRPLRSGRVDAQRPPDAHRRHPNGCAVQRQAGGESGALSNPAPADQHGEFPSGNVLWSPRLGFNFDPVGMAAPSCGAASDISPVGRPMCGSRMPS